MRSFLFVLAALLAVRMAAAPAPGKKDVLVLPTFVVVGFRIPSSWMEVAWECRGPIPFSLIKRAWVSKVGHDTPAEKAGVRKGDALLSFDTEPIRTMSGERLHSLLGLERDPGTKLVLTLQTPGQDPRTVTIVFEKGPFR